MMGFLHGIPVSWSSLFLLMLGAFAAYVAAGAIYRLYISPLAKFPGPKIAALTYWHEFHYDLVKGGRFQGRIAEMHEQYGEKALPLLLVGYTDSF